MTASSTMRTIWVPGAAASIALITAAVPATAATSYVRPPYGCYRVNVDGLNVRERPYAASAAIATAHLGEIVIKSRRFCNWRGYFCEIEFLRDGRPMRGYADKNFMEAAPCPASLARPVN